MENWVTDVESFKFHREITEDGKELFFDHGAPLFTVGNPDVLGIISEWEARGFVAEWKENFASFDCISGKFVDFEKVSTLSYFNSYNISKSNSCQQHLAFLL